MRLLAMQKGGVKRIVGGIVLSVAIAGVLYLTTVLVLDAMMRGD